MNNIILFVVAILNMAIALYILCYRAGSARYRPVVSILAWVLVCVCGGCGLFFGLTGRGFVGWWYVCVVVALFVLVCRCRGNVAKLFRW